VWSGNGVGAEIEAALRQVDAAWEDAGRATPPTRVAGFWYSLARDGQQRLQSYVYDYLEVFSPDVARAVSRTMDRSSPDRVNESLDAMEELGCDECYLVPATCDLAEVERAAELVAKRG